MTAFAILGCYIMIYFFFALTSGLKLLSSLIDSIGDLAAWLAGMIFLLVVFLLLQMIVSIFAEGFWAAVLLIVVITVICCLIAPIAALLGSIALIIIELLGGIILTICEYAYLLLEKLGNLCEKGLEYFLGALNKQTLVS